MADSNPGHQPERPGRHDVRQALYNDRRSGPAFEIQVPLERIATVHGFVVDLDPDLLEPGNPIAPPAADPEVFLAGIRPMLDRHPVLRHSTIRATGRGLHLLVNLSQPVELTSDGDQRHWDELARLVQGSIPSDPAAAGLKVLTRPAGAINSKNGLAVRDLAEGTPIDPAVVVEFAAAVQAAPFQQLAIILLGEDREALPCPACREPGSRLAIGDSAGTCYHCGTVRCRELFALVVRRDPADVPAAPRGRGSKRKGARRA